VNRAYTNCIFNRSANNNTAQRDQQQIMSWVHMHLISTQLNYNQNTSKLTRWHQSFPTETKPNPVELQNATEPIHPANNFFSFSSFRPCVHIAYKSRGNLNSRIGGAMQSARKDATWGSILLGSIRCVFSAIRSACSSALPQPNASSSGSWRLR
jgi:hypothetical protein